MRILGIDPGTRVAGYGCVDAASSGVALVEAGVFRLGREGDALGKRLAALDEDLGETIARLKPRVICVEAVFSHARWPGSAITMAHARGVVLLAAQRSEAELLEIPPAEVKKATTGSGRASKEQVRRAVEAALNPGAPLAPADVSDALAIALAAERRALTGRS